MVLSSDLNCKHSDLLLLGIYKQALQDSCGGFGEAFFLVYCLGFGFFLFGGLLGFCV